MSLSGCSMWSEIRLFENVALNLSCECEITLRSPVQNPFPCLANRRPFTGGEGILTLIQVPEDGGSFIKCSVRVLI